MRVGTLPLLPYHAPGDAGARSAGRGSRRTTTRFCWPTTARSSPPPIWRRPPTPLEELEETARLHLLLHGHATRPLTERRSTIARTAPMTARCRSTAHDRAAPRPPPPWSLPRRGSAKRVGVPADDARFVADSLVTSDMWGHPSHGMPRLDWYVARLRTGVMTPVTDAGTRQRLRGGRRPRRPRRDRTSRHRPRVRRGGRPSARARYRRSCRPQQQPLRHRRLLDPHARRARLRRNPDHQRQPGDGAVGRQRKMIGANPWSIAVARRLPRHRRSRHRQHRRRAGQDLRCRAKGEPHPRGWAIDAAGSPTTDPTGSHRRAPSLPMAGTRATRSPS